jgi:hypothetical protein
MRKCPLYSILRPYFTAKPFAYYIIPQVFTPRLPAIVIAPAFCRIATYAVFIASIGAIVGYPRVSGCVAFRMETVAAGKPVIRKTNASGKMHWVSLSSAYAHAMRSCDAHSAGSGVGSRKTIFSPAARSGFPGSADSVARVFAFEGVSAVAASGFSEVDGFAGLVGTGNASIGYWIAFVGADSCLLLRTRVERCATYIFSQVFVV